MNGYRVGLIAEGYLDDPISHPGWEVKPLQVPDALRTLAVSAWARANEGTSIRWSDEAGPTVPPVHLIALDGAFSALSPEAAIAKARPALEALYRAIRFRQFGSGRYVAFVAVNVDQPSEALATFDVRTVAQAHHTVEGGAHWDKAGELVGMARAIETSPVGLLLTDLFAEALADSSLEGGIARLWSVLEVIADRFRPIASRQDRLLRRLGLFRRGDSTLRRVRAALAHVGLTGRVDVKRVYQIRNEFVHDGKRGTDRAQVQRLHAKLIEAVFLAIVRSDFKAIDPASPPFKVPPNLPTRRVALRHPEPSQRPTDIAGGG